MTIYPVKRGTPSVYFQFDNPHALKISNAKATLLKEDGSVVSPSTDMKRVAGNLYILPISPILDPGNYIVVASGKRGSERVSGKILLKISRQK